MPCYTTQIGNDHLKPTLTSQNEALAPCSPKEVEGKLRPVHFASRVFSDIEAGSHTMQIELFGVKWALKQFRLYVLGKQTKVVTDHTNFKMPNFR